MMMGKDGTVEVEREGAADCKVSNYYRQKQLNGDRGTELRRGQDKRQDRIEREGGRAERMTYKEQGERSFRFRRSANHVTCKLSATAAAADCVADNINTERERARVARGERI